MWSSARRWWRVAVLGILGALVVPLCLIGIVTFVAQPVRFLGTSMMPTYRDGDRLLLDRVTSRYRRGDVVAFHYPLDPSKSYIKRIVGLPGEQIEIRGGQVLIDGAVLAEPYVSEKFNRVPSRYSPEVVPAGHVYVMGDNRDASNDSRAWGPVPLELIYGKVLFRYG